MDKRLEEKLMQEGVQNDKLLEAAIKRLTARIADGFPPKVAVRLVVKTKEESAKIDRCVESIMSDKDFSPKKGRTKKESAFAICTSQILGSRGFSHLGFLRQVAAEAGADPTPEQQADAILRDLRNPDSVAYRSYLTPDKKALDNDKIFDDLIGFYVMTPQEAKQVIERLGRGWEALKQRSLEMSKEVKEPARQQEQREQQYRKEVGQPAVTSAQQPGFTVVDGVLLPTNMDQTGDTPLFEEE